MSALEQAFAEHFDGTPTHLAAAPGRVNLIGEHIDYCDLPVLPMAIQRGVRLELRARDDGLVRIHNVRAEYEPVEFELGPGLERGPDGHWSNYLRAPANELARRYAIWRGFDGVVESDVPVAAGLASSSALVNAVGLALIHVNEVGFDDPLQIADVMAEAERFTGTRGGGMDQAISLAGRDRCAARIDFAPLRLRHLPVPPDWRFVVADSTRPAEKSGSARQVYNQRRTECEEALDALGNALAESLELPRRPDSYPRLLRDLGHARALQVVEKSLAPPLLKRARHVLTEARRVEIAVDLLASADAIGFGDLMNASHASLRGDYLVSTVELDELVELALEGGAYGARLTGAGLGGAIVALADPGSVDGVLRTLREGYYEPRGLADEVADRLFVAEPSAGAACAPLGA